MNDFEKRNKNLERRISGDTQEEDFIQSKKGTAGKSIAEHTVGEGETLGQIAQKYYGHSTRDYWMVIYEANKGTIGDNPGLIKPGMALQIPELPDNLKK